LGGATASIVYVHLEKEIQSSTRFLQHLFFKSAIGVLNRRAFARKSLGAGISYV
jgi:hypothetical protein